MARLENGNRLAPLDDQFWERTVTETTRGGGVQFLKKDMMAMSVLTAVSICGVVIGNGLNGNEVDPVYGVLSGLMLAPFIWCVWFGILGLMGKVSH